MERPYVICHILSSLDGKINGPFMGTEAVGALGAEYGKYRTKVNADAWLYGTTTTKEFTGFRKPVKCRMGILSRTPGQSCIMFRWMWTVRSDGSQGHSVIKGGHRLM